MDLHERRFLTTTDRAYLEDIEVALVRVHGVAPERAARAVRPLVVAVRRQRAAGSQTPTTSFFGYGSAGVHAEALAALLVAPRASGTVSLVLLGLLAAVAGLLGIRVALGLAFRRFEPVRLGTVDLSLAVLVVIVILAIARSSALLASPKRGTWIALSLILGAALGVGATFFLRVATIERTLVTIPWWLAAVIALLSGAVTWLLTWPDDQRALGNPE